MRADDEVEVVLVQEVRHDVRPEDVGDAAVVLGPAGDVRLRIRPEQVADEALAVSRLKRTT